MCVSFSELNIPFKHLRDLCYSWIIDCYWTWCWYCCLVGTRLTFWSCLRSWRCSWICISCSWRRCFSGRFRVLVCFGWISHYAILCFVFRAWCFEVFGLVFLGFDGLGGFVGIFFVRRVGCLFVYYCYNRYYFSMDLKTTVIFWTIHYFKLSAHTLLSFYSSITKGKATQP